MMKRSLTAVAVLAAATLALTACSGASGATDDGDGAGATVKPLSIGNFLDVTSWDP
ncbi:putative small secreted protein [Leucobacter luti]|nr:hypothetical protein [Leucobacter luti]MCW2288288.1 putative small secreted protein [Leucobacter luti]